MATSISFSYDGEDYTLEFNRSSVSVLERKYKFTINDVEELRVSAFPDLFACAFIMHHPNVKRSVVDEIFDSMGSKSELIEALCEMYIEVVQSVMSEEPAKGKATSWQVNKPKSSQ